MVQTLTLFFAYLGVTIGMNEIMHIQDVYADQSVRTYLSLVSALYTRQGGRDVGLIRLLIMCIVIKYATFSRILGVGLFVRAILVITGSY